MPDIFNDLCWLPVNFYCIGTMAQDHKMNHSIGSREIPGIVVCCLEGSKKSSGDHGKYRYRWSDASWGNTTQWKRVCVMLQLLLLSPFTWYLFITHSLNHLDPTSENWRWGILPEPEWTTSSWSYDCSCYTEVTTLHITLPPPPPALL